MTGEGFNQKMDRDHPRRRAESGICEFGGREHVRGEEEGSEVVPFGDV